MNQESETTSPGIVVLSSSLQILHMNRHAMALLSQLKHTTQSIETERTVTAPLHQHCRELIEVLQARVSSNNWQQFRQYCVIGDSTHTILLKGFALPDRRGLSHCRIVILLCPHDPASMPENGKWNLCSASPRASAWVQTCHTQSAREGDGAILRLGLIEVSEGAKDEQ